MSRADSRQQVPVKDEKIDNLTISTKLSTDQLICKTPQESPAPSIRSLKVEKTKTTKKQKEKSHYDGLVYLGTMQILFGLLMIVFGILVIVHRARMSQLGGGIWGGCLSVITGITGLIATSRNWCPLKTTAQKVTHTIFLALCLISVAITQLVIVFTATGLARDITFLQTDDQTPIPSLPTDITFTNLPSNYLAILSNSGLVIVSAIACCCAIASAYLSSRFLCPCFRTEEELHNEKMQIKAKEAFVNSWIGQHNQPLYFVTAPPSGKTKKMISNTLPTPLINYSPPLIPAAPSTVYPLIPAPLGQIPSPLIHPYLKDCPRRIRKYYHPVQEKVSNYEKRQRCKSRESLNHPITTEDLVKTYTGLDRTIAEEFIEICDSRNHSLCSVSSCHSCQGGCSCTEGCTGGCTTCTSLCNTSDVSREEKA